MAITSTLNTPISFSSLRSEFKRTASGSIGLQELYRGGSHIPNENFYANNIPAAAAGTIKVSDFYGTTKGYEGAQYTNVSLIPITYLQDLPLSVDRVRVILISGGGAGKLRYGSTAADTWLAGGAGGFCMGYFYGLISLGNQYGRGNFRIVTEGSAGGGPVMWTANATQDGQYGLTSNSSASHPARVRFQQSISGVWYDVHSITITTSNYTGNGGRFLSTTAGEYFGGKGFQVINTAAPPAPAPGFVGAAGGPWGVGSGFTVEKIMNGGDATGGDAGCPGGVKFNVDGSAPYAVITPAISGGTLSEPNFTVASNGAFPALRAGDYAYGGTFITGQWNATATRPYFSLVQPEQASGPGYVRIQY